VLLVVVFVAATSALTRRTALGLLIEAVGGNSEASRLAGVRARRVKLMVYVFCALCAATAGLVDASTLPGADANHSGLWIELDAILAVVIGGTPLTGGRFSIGGTVVGALILQTLKTTIFTIGIPAQANMVFEAAVVIVICLLQSEEFRGRAATLLRGRGPSRPPSTAAGPSEPASVEVAP
jgi:ribose/xylose/arabinose/galactoside ABC-type transport system permease subunit